jgi:hypothetical protein
VKIGGYYEFQFGPADASQSARGRLSEVLSGERHIYYAFQLDNGTLLAFPVPELRELQLIDEPLPDIS